MDELELEVNEAPYTIRTGQTFKLNRPIDIIDLEPGLTLTIDNIQRNVDGIYIYFNIENQPDREEIIYKFAFENLLEDDAFTRL